MTPKESARIRYDEHGLVPAVVQDVRTGEVLMVAWMNEDSLKLSLETGYTHFWSRSRQKLWKKGETSGHLQRIRGMWFDCDADTLLVAVDQTGPACHTGNRSCFYEALAAPEGDKEPPRRILAALEKVIADRRSNPRDGSYVSHLFAVGGELMRAKVLEESGEVAEASREEDRGQVIYESADLVFHLMVLLAAHGISVEEIEKELEKRFGNPPKKEKKEKNISEE